ncbi:MAG: N-acyl-D-glucosamine 2-epimerase [Desulfatiglans sp.]|nr:N-acyl-D-glucosamine 2-epimerase [Desulfatiglans sp.]
MENITDIKTEFINEVGQSILPFWLRFSVDNKNGGFYGRVDNLGNAIPDAPKSLILNTRILWTFSEAYSAFGSMEYLKMADHAYDYLHEFFYDREHGGVYWLLDSQGVPLDDKKKAYGHAFLVYALASYYRVTGKRSVLDSAVGVFNLIERHFLDKENGGYFEAALRDWSVAEDMRLSAIDMNEKKSMNAHLHILEAYTNLLRVWRNPTLKEQLKNLLKIFQDHIIDQKTSHFNLFFDEAWQIKSRLVSPGHDIEGSWLLFESAELLNDPDLKAEFKNISALLATAVLDRCLDHDGSLVYEIHPDGVKNMEKHWWVQAEAMVGFLNAYELTGERKFYDAMLRVWGYIKNNLIDKENAEWFYKLLHDGTVDDKEPKISEWKGPYHNSRACLEIAGRLNRMSKG